MLVDVQLFVVVVKSSSSVSEAVKWIGRGSLVQSNSVEP